MEFDWRYLDLDEIKEKLEPTLKGIEDELYRLMCMDKPPKINEGKYAQQIMSKLKTILGNPIENPIMKYGEAENYYFNDENSLKHIQEKYILILELQDYIISKSNISFIYDRYIILKILQLTLNTYNSFIDDCQSGINARNEDIANIFLDIETMLIADRNYSAETNTRNAKAIDNTNRYKRENGGYGIEYQKEENKTENVVFNITNEEVQKKLHNQFGIGAIENKK